MKEDKLIFEENIITNFINDLQEEQDKFLQNKIIDHIIQNGKKYRVINICESKVKEIVDNGLKYEQLRKKNEELKSHLKKCKACGEYDFIDNINNFCCYCGKDIDTGYTLEEMKEKGLPYPIDKRNSQTKLAEYEKLGTVEEFKELKEQRIIVTRGRESGKLITQKALKYDLLKKELEVYKKALHTALEECRYIEIEENVMPNFLEEARKELEK